LAEAQRAEARAAERGAAAAAAGKADAVATPGMSTDDDAGHVAEPAESTEGVASPYEVQLTEHMLASAASRQRELEVHAPLDLVTIPHSLSFSLRTCGLRARERSTHTLSTTHASMCPQEVVAERDRLRAALRVAEAATAAATAEVDRRDAALQRGASRERALQHARDNALSRASAGPPHTPSTPRASSHTARSKTKPLAQRPTSSFSSPSALTPQAVRAASASPAQSNVSVDAAAGHKRGGDGDAGEHGVHKGARGSQGTATGVADTTRVRQLRARCEAAEAAVAAAEERAKLLQRQLETVTREGVEEIELCERFKAMGQGLQRQIALLEEELELVQSESSEREACLRRVTEEAEEAQAQAAGRLRELEARCEAAEAAAAEATMVRRHTEEMGRLVAAVAQRGKAMEEDRERLMRRLQETQQQLLASQQTLHHAQV
jgi:DNA repair exonuclease SbcCD ATPase subunit